MTQMSAFSWLLSCYLDVCHVSPSSLAGARIYLAGSLKKPGKKQAYAWPSLWMVFISTTWIVSFALMWGGVMSE